MTEVLSGGCPSTPAQQPLLEPPGCAENDENEGHDKKYQGQHESGIVGALGKGEQIAKAAGRPDKLADNRSGECEADSDLQVSHDPCRHERQIDFAKYGPSAPAQGADPLNKSRVDLLDTGVHREEDENGNQDERERNFRSE